ncbi:MAG: TRAP transporter TatT component family protein [Leptospiraceae bacterium]|nr:TRAP transporter TatT component family protein [Leptospiraceae bacterium]MDW8307638.1 TRAP transporter TatT component family protein [Leptospiraceae bacterium]
MRQLFLLVMITLLMPSCSLRKLAIREVVLAMEESRQSFEGESDLRLAESALSGNLKLLEALLMQDPDNERLRLFLAQGYAGYALAFVEDLAEEQEFRGEEGKSERERARKFYRRARQFLETTLEKRLGKLEEMPLEELRLALTKTKAQDVPYLFWYAFSWGSEINLSRDDLRNLMQLPKVELLMARVKELEESYFYGGAYLFEGIYYGSRGETLGGDLERSQRAFQKALQYARGKFLMTQYYYAATYCVFAQEKGCFEDNLKNILEAPEDLFPPQGLANALARKKAQRLWEKRKELFLEN